MERFSLLIFLTVFININLSGQTDPRWTASTDAKSVAKGDNFTVTYTLENAQGANFTPPDFEHFQQLQAPTRNSSTTMINGRTTYTSGWTFILQAQRTGKFWIHPASIEIDGKRVFTKKLQVEVVKGRITTSSGPQQLEDLKKVVYIKSNISDSIAVVGQPLVYELKLYWVPDLLNARLMAEPDLKGFYQEDNPRGAYQTVKEVIDGVTFRSKTIYKSIIYPQQEGKLRIGSYRVIADVEKGTRRRRRSIFSTPEYVRLDLKSPIININVVSLPANAPTDFSGAVGTLDLSCSVDQRVVTTDDAVTLTVTLDGEGDTKQMQAPTFNYSDSMEVYPPKLVGEETFETARSLLKRKSFEYVLLPKYPGKYNIAPTYSYFDVDEMTYRSLVCDTIELRVSKGSNPIGTTTMKDPVIDDGLAGIVTSGHTPIPTLNPMPSAIQWSLFGIPIVSMLAMLGVFYVRKNAPEIDAGQLRKNKAREMALSKLKAAKLEMDRNTPRAFYDELSKGMHGYLEDKIGIPLSSLNEGFIREKLTSLDLESHLVEKFMGILKNCQLALYAGKTGEDAMLQSYTEAGELIEALEEQLAN